MISFCSFEVPNPQSPPPSVPIPGQPESLGEEESFKCGICGNVYNSKVELDVHLNIEHEPQERKSRK